MEVSGLQPWIHQVFRVDPKPARPEWNDLRPPRFHSDAARLHPLRTGHGESTGPLPV